MASQSQHDAQFIRPRTPTERRAYVQGFEAGVEAALQEVRRLNFGDVAARAQPRVALRLEAMTLGDDD